mmetsp:Transcript_34657/g.55386  ORF Transcript_34657/g.55386 Transcript_34657/m.55386 type:complete len:89 (-) Transcript_34657:716-982(-)
MFPCAFLPEANKLQSQEDPSIGLTTWMKLSRSAPNAHIARNINLIIINSSSEGFGGIHFRYMIWQSRVRALIGTPTLVCATSESEAKK